MFSVAKKPGHPSPWSSLQAEPLMLGDRLRGLRARQGMTQVQLARASGMSQTAVSEIENGKVPNPQVGTLASLARGLGVGVEELTGVAVVEPLSEAEWAEVRRAWDALSPADQRNMLSVIRRLAVAVDVTMPDLRDLDDEERAIVMGSEPELRLAVANALRQLRQIDRETGSFERLEQQPHAQARRARRS